MPGWLNKAEESFQPVTVRQYDVLPIPSVDRGWTGLPRRTLTFVSLDRYRYSSSAPRYTARSLTSPRLISHYAHLAQRHLSRWRQVTVQSHQALTNTPSLGSIDVSGLAFVGELRATPERLRGFWLRRMGPMLPSCPKARPHLQGRLTNGSHETGPVENKLATGVFRPWRRE